MAGCLQNVVSPAVVFAKRKGRCAIATHSAPGGVFQHVFGARHILLELRRLELCYPRVVVTMASQFVSRCDDLPQHRWVAFSHPAQGEKSAFHPEFGHQPQHPIHVQFDPLGLGRPRVFGDVALKRRHLKIIFNVDREGVNSGPNRETFWHHRQPRSLPR